MEMQMVRTGTAARPTISALKIPVALTIVRAVGVAPWTTLPDGCATIST
jgi:hypothetical protein